MYCPICSTIVSPSQNFCRKCGFGLETTAKSVSEQLPSKADESLWQPKNKLERLGVAALSVFGTGLLGLLAYLVGSKLMMSQGKLLAALGILAFIVIAGCGLLSVILFAKANELKEASGKRQLEPPNVRGDRDKSNIFTPVKPESIPSVTERTTELLLSDRKNDSEQTKV